MVLRFIYFEEMCSVKSFGKNYKNMLTKSVLVYYTNSTLTQCNDLINDISMK